MSEDTQSIAKSVENNAILIKTLSESIGMHSDEIEKIAKDVIEHPDKYDEKAIKDLDVRMNNLKELIKESHINLMNMPKPKN